jgi:hypothetical protein
MTIPSQTTQGYDVDDDDDDDDDDVVLGFYSM